MAILNQTIQNLEGVGKVTAELLASELNIKTYKDLLYCFPFRYTDRSKIYPINELNINQVESQIIGKITKIELVGHKKAERLIIDFEDNTGNLELIWFKPPKWLKSSLVTNQEYLVFGRLKWFNGKLQISHPEITKYHANFKFGLGLQPVYSSTEKLSKANINQRSFRKWTKKYTFRIK